VALLQDPKEGQHFQWAIPKQLHTTTTKTEKSKITAKKSNTQTRTPEAVMQEVRYIEELKQYLKHKVQNFKAGSVRNHVIQWKGVTTDIELLQTISGLYIPANYISTAPNKSYPIEK